MQGGQRPGGQSSVQWCTPQPFVRPHMAPQVCGTRPSFLIHSGLVSLPQKQV